MNPQRIRRRSFLQASAAWGAAAMLPARAQTPAANDRLRTVHVGVGNMGWGDLRQIASHLHVEVAGLCDVDRDKLQHAQQAYPAAKSFADFREMLSSMGDSIDAVVVSTPDHTHAAAAMTAMQIGKPVYCQKPLTHDVHEARRLREVSAERSLVTQMGIQIHSLGVYRRAVAMLGSGVIGKVSHVYAWCGKGWGYDGGPLAGTQPAPATLDWNLWLGTAEERPYVPQVYHPVEWRRFIDFGTGTLGDMGAHLFDTPYAALELTAPKSARAVCRLPTGIGHPEQNKVEFEFPGTAHTTDPVKWTWLDGAAAPKTLPGTRLPPEVKLPSTGAYMVGEEGDMLLPHWAEATLFPVEKYASYERPDLQDKNHYHEWVDACRGEGETTASFGYAGPLTEALLLGVVATRFPGETVEWDADAMRVTNIAEANDLLRRNYRSGFEVEGL